MTSVLQGSAAPCYCCLQRRPHILLSSSTSTNPRYLLYGSVTRLGIRRLSSWKGLKHLDISLRRNLSHLEKTRKSNRMAVYASLFGVGAPEVLVIGVVALLVFGPKGLAEIARNLGKTLRSFQPTIRELQEVSREFKSTFEREIGLDEMTSPINNSYRSRSIVNESQQPISDPNVSPIAEPSEEHMKIREAQLAATTKSQVNPPEEQPQDISPITEPSEEHMKIREAQLAATTKSQANPPEELPQDLSPIAEPSEELMKIREAQLAATTKSQVNPPEEQPHKISSLERAKDEG